MSILSARRSPYPYHFKIGSVGLMLGSPTTPGRAGAGAMLVSSKSQDIAQVAPPDFSYGGRSPISDREQPYESLTLGMGMKVQEKWQDFRYAYAEGVDLSVWPWCKGPEITLLTPPSVDATTGVRSFFELGSSLYCAEGRYILRRDSDATWTMVKDFGSGISVLNLAVFTSNFDGVQRVFVALSSGPAQYSSNGTAWTPMATFSALAFSVIGREFWWADNTNRLRKCDTNADPTVEANYTSLMFLVGDKSSPVSSLAVTAAGTLLILKTDGIYTLDGAGEDHQLFPFLKFATNPNNGRWWGQFENSVYTSYGQTFIRVNPDLSMEEIGPQKLVNNDTPARGQVTTFSGVGSMFAYAGIYNPDTLTGYLGKFGSWISQGLGSDQGSLEPRHVDVWHASLSAPFTSRAMQALFVSSIGAPTGHTRTYLGFSDGTVGWMVNPCVPNPAACSAYRFAVGDGFVELPAWHGGFHASAKSVRHALVTGTLLNASNYVTLEYKLDPSASSWTQLGTVFDQMTYEQAAFPTDATCVLANFRVHLHNTANTASPLVSAFSIGHAFRPQRFMTVQVEVLCSDGLVRRDGVPLRIGRREIQRVVEAAIDTPGAVTCTLPDETVQQLSFTDYSVSKAFDEVGRQWRGSLALKAVQWTPGGGVSGG